MRGGGVWTTWSDPWHAHGIMPWDVTLMGRTHRWFGLVYQVG